MYRHLSLPRHAPGDIYRSVGSPQKARDVLGFHAEVSLVDGLKETIDWMRA